jgi:molybdate transport system regulatory protein
MDPDESVATTAEAGEWSGEAAATARLRVDEVVFGADDAALLRAIAKVGSVSGAASELGRSRARALGRLETLEDGFGSLVERTRGGAGGGGSELTAGAHDLLARFDRLQATLSGTAGAGETTLAGEVSAVDGELADVETAAGSVRALVAGSVAVGDAAEVGVRADVVTLHAPEDTPDPDATSARNRFSGTVVDVDRGASVARVAVDVGAADPVTALVTVESVERLHLETGRPVVVSFKATATRVTPR